MKRLLIVFALLCMTVPMGARTRPINVPVTLSAAVPMYLTINNDHWRNIAIGFSMTETDTGQMQLIVHCHWVNKVEFLPVGEYHTIDLLAGGYTISRHETMLLVKKVLRGNQTLTMDLVFRQ